jgi:iron complex transport system ATP-binding protein
VSAALQCIGLACGYPDRTVLQGIDLSLDAGGVTTLLGPNGSGKSTLLKTIVGEIPALAGKILIEGIDAQTLTARERAQSIAFVPSEERTEFPFLVREIVAMGRIPHSEGLFDSEEDVRITWDAMNRAECEELADRPVTNISAGEHQRALIGRALAQQAPLLLFDEPTSHLDPGHQVNFVLLVRQLAKSGLSILVALHDLNLAAHLAQHAVLLDEGKISCAGTVSDVLENPALDKAYGTSFERMKGSDGVLRLSPRFKAPV